MLELAFTFFLIARILQIIACIAIKPSDLQMIIYSKTKVMETFVSCMENQHKSACCFPACLM